MKVVSFQSHEASQEGTVVLSHGKGEIVCVGWGEDWSRQDGKKLSAEARKACVGAFQDWQDG